MDWGTLLEGLVAAGSGGVLGVLGSLVSGFFKGKQQKADREFEEKKWSHEENLHKLQMESRAQETEDERELVTLQGSQEGMLESIKADTAIGPVHMWVNDFKACFRPFLTIALWILALIVFRSLVRNPDEILEPEQVIQLVRYMVYTVFFCASTATTWWFGDRALAPPKLTK